MSGSKRNGSSKGKGSPKGNNDDDDKDNDDVTTVKLSNHTVVAITKNLT